MQFTVSIALIIGTIGTSLGYPMQPTIFFMAPWRTSILNIRLRPEASVHDALKNIERLCTQFNPGQPVTSLRSE